jgi:hypothetical protein
VKERWLTLLLAAAAAMLFYILVFPKPVPDAQKVSQPLSTDSGVAGEAALWRWLQAENIPVVSLRYRYDHLPRSSDGAPSTGNVLVTVMPHKLRIRKDEWKPLFDWIDAGNTVMVIAALDDTPNWSAESGAGWLEQLTQLTHIKFDIKKLQLDLKNLLGIPLIEMVPQGQHPLLAAVHSIRGTSDQPASRWTATDVAPAMSLQLLKRSDSGAPVLFLNRRAKGQILVSTLASPFSNGEIDAADNAQLISNIIAWSRSASGSVIFDDAHQGLTAYYDPRAFFADPRLHRTLLWIVLLWLVFVLGPLPLRSVQSLWNPVSDTALIEASGRFYSAAVPAIEAAHRLFENFFNALRRRLNLPENGAPLWDWLATQSRIRDDERALLQNLYSKVYASERIELTKLQQLLSNLQGKLA